MPELLADVNFLERLFVEDVRVAEQERQEGCRHCGGRLHQAHYPRKVRGISEEGAQYFERRFSFCCARCRRRQTPPSVRFQSRAVYAAVAILIAGAVAVQQSVAEAMRQLGAARRTIARWREWFRRDLPSSDWWRRQSGQFGEQPTVERMPLSLLEQIAATTRAQRILRALRLLSGARFSTVDVFTQKMADSTERSAR